jgi:hypothetical protein
MDCHSDDYQLDNALLPIQTLFEASQHNMGETYLRRAAGCARCHTNEGYQHYLTAGDAPAQTTSSRISCFTCHAPHTNQNFELRKQDPTALDLGGTYNKGASNACVVCHQARVPVPSIAHADSAITSSRWGPHHSTQGSILAGTGAYEFNGAYSSSAHSTIATGCVQCHMAGVVSAANAGDHSFAVTYAGTGGDVVNRLGCSGTGCHSFASDAAATTFVHDAQEEIEAKLAEVRGILVANGWVNDTSGLLNAGNGSGSNPPPLALTEDERGAVFNFYMFEEDHSLGVHNPMYANEVLDATIAFLTDK